MARKTPRAEDTAPLREEDSDLFTEYKIRLLPEHLSALRSLAEHELATNKDHFARPPRADRRPAVSNKERMLWLANSGDTEKLTRYHLYAASRSQREANKLLRQWYAAAHPHTGHVGRPTGFVPYSARLKIMMGWIAGRMAAEQAAQITARERRITKGAERLREREERGLVSLTA